MWKAALISAVLMFPAAAFAEDRVEGMAVEADDGSVIGRVVDVERDEDGRIVSAMLSGVSAPADAPRAMTRERAPEFPIPDRRERNVASAEPRDALDLPAGGWARRVR